MVPLSSIRPFVLLTSFALRWFKACYTSMGPTADTDNNNKNKTSISSYRSYRIFMCRPLHPRFWICVMRWGSLREARFYPEPAEARRHQTWSPGTARHGTAFFFFYAPNARALWACVVFGEWDDGERHTPLLTIYMIFTPRDRTVGSLSDSYFIVLQQQSVNCVMALQYAYKTRVPPPQRARTAFKKN